MANRPPAAQPLTSDERQLIKSWLVEFSQTWTDARLEECVASLPPANDRLRVPALIELVKIDLRRRWEQGERLELESYLLRYGELGTCETTPAGLVRAELESRQKAGTPAPLEEIRARFPRQAVQLESGSKGAVTMIGSRLASETIVRPGPETPPILPASSSPSALPEQIGPYRILRRLGQGGMGTVYLARDERLDRDVALKVPRFDPDEGPQLRERFYREARAAAALRHPNVCSIHEIGEADGVPYLTMAYIEGRPLTDYIDKNGVSAIQAALLVRKLALALREAHQLGIVHRDLKPANIMIDQRKEPVIMDFGLARLEHHELAALRQRSTKVTGEKGNARLTRMGAILGTPQYMPPEQVTGNLDAMGPRCDIYSLGIILYELLTGRTPFVGPPSIVLGLVMTQPVPPPTTYRPNLDAELVSICMKAVAQKPGGRFASMDELAAALGVYLKPATKGQNTSPVAQLIPIAQSAAPVAQVVPVAQVAPSTPAVEHPDNGENPAQLKPRRLINWAVLGPVLGVCFCLLVSLIWAMSRQASGSNGSSAPQPGNQGGLRMLDLAPVVMAAGEKHFLQIGVVREGDCTGPIRIDIEGLPDNVVAASPVFLAPEESAMMLELVALPQVRPIQTNVRVTATVGTHQSEGWFPFTIRTPTNVKGSLLLAFDLRFSVPRGQSQTWEIGVRRLDFFGPVQVHLEDLPAKVACKAVKLPADDTVAGLEVVSAADAVPDTYVVRIVATGGRLRTEERAQLIILDQGSMELRRLPRDHLFSRNDKLIRTVSLSP